MSPKRGFRCIHCGSNATPESFIDSNNAHNKMLMSLLVLITVLTCCLGFPVLFLYPFLAWRKHRCADCGIGLG